MPIKGYGVLTAKVLERHREGTAKTPHYQVLLEAPDRTRFRAAVNVLSKQAPSELKYLLVEDFHHPVTAAVEALGRGWHPLQSAAGGAALDYVRGNLFDPAAMRTLPADAPGADNDLPDLIDHYIMRAADHDDATLSVFGQRWGPEQGKADETFGFQPGNGVHDVHMNQGNSKAFAKDDGVWQDGGLLINASPEAVDLAGWKIVGRGGHRGPLPAAKLTAGATLSVPLTDGVVLGNSGGTISLLDATGLKVDGVSYTEAQARREGWMVTF